MSQSLLASWVMAAGFSRARQHQPKEVLFMIPGGKFHFILWELHTLLSLLPRPKGLTQCSAWPVAHLVPQPEWGPFYCLVFQPGAATAKKLQGAHCCVLSRVTLTPWGGLRHWPRRQAGGCVLTCRRHNACDPLHHCWQILPLPTLQTHNTFLLFLLYLSFGEN